MSIIHPARRPGYLEGWQIYALILLILLPFVAWVATTFWLRVAIRRRSLEKPVKVSLVPFWVPTVFHCFALFQLSNFLPKLSELYSPEKPLLVKIGNKEIFIFNDLSHAKDILSMSQRVARDSAGTLPWHGPHGVPNEALGLSKAQGSGRPELAPREFHTKPVQTVISAAKYLSSPHLDSLGERYVDGFVNHLGLLQKSEEWMYFPDLYCILQNLVIRSSLEALIGSKIFAIYPDFVNDLRLFMHFTPKYQQQLASWRYPDAYKVVDRLLGGLKRWRGLAHKHSDCSDDAEWEPYLGSRFTRARHNQAANLPGITADTMAAEDLGMIYACTHNLPPVLHWLLVEVLQDDELLGELMSEVQQCGTAGAASFDHKRLMSQPLLQSSYSEVLRLYTAGVISRSIEGQKVDIGGVKIPEKSHLLVHTRSLFMNYDAWDALGRIKDKPLDYFDAERFLRRHSPEKKSRSTPDRHFSEDDVSEVFFPFGGGDHACPGRQIAKHHVLTAFAALLTRYDVELTGMETHHVQPDMSHWPFGALPPNSDMPFRIRRKIVA